MNPIDIKQAIAKSINDFSKGNLFDNSINLFKTLGYNTSRQSRLSKNTIKGFISDIPDAASKINNEKALVEDWKCIELLFQLTTSDMSAQVSMFDDKRVDNKIIEAYLFFAIELTGDSYSRTQLSVITRELNKVFPMPVMILFKYNSLLTLSVINRRQHKRDESKDVLEKVTLINGIRTEEPHRAHIEILYDLSFDALNRDGDITSWVELHKAWQKTLDTKELNKRFYSELFNWYLWAIHSVSFPNDVSDAKDDKIYNSESVIRMLTRLIFVWFIKEKKLIPENLFNERFLLGILNAFDPKSKKNSTYYRAILQNLFFATLNTPMDKDINAESEDEERRFIDLAKKKYNEHYLDQTKYRYRDSFTKPDDALKLFSSIPFLNGGLFECLDFIEEGKEIRYDGFSSTEDRQAFVPDKLFFANEFTIDLNEEYGTKGKQYKVKGLINILNGYKFTITENTPLEEEIALDPELLGKVFENLLASYNPETQSTARKQTGSFYTPREIVNYMVEESLLAFLKQKLGNTDADENKLRELFAYTDTPHPFTIKETDKLIEALSDCKILDPACGSGAFPMGILHKIVFLLNKLDPDNSKWKELQKQRATDETKDVFNCVDKEERQLRLNEINKAFDENINHPDYARKLFLIENCIYGLDIQQIAIQISKLRFFISLMVDQKVDDSKPNRNILSMPNLETKFVAANTLISIEKPKGQLSLMDMNIEIADKETELKHIRHKIFFTRKYSDKKKLKEKEKKCREELKKILLSNNMERTAAEQLAGWNPFDPMKSASFFDSETMFGFTEGFDIVIGNPPYVRPRNEDSILLNYYRKHYTVAHNQLDLFHLFIELASHLLTNKGVNTFIISNAFLANENTEKLRKFILDNVALLKIVDIKEQVFEGASVDTIVYLFTKEIAKDTNNVEYILIKDGEFRVEHIFSQKLFYKNPRYNFTISLNSKLKEAFDSMQKTAERVESFFHVTTGIKEYQVGKGTPPQKQSHKDNRAFNASLKKDNSYIPEIRGKNLSPFKIKWDGEHIKYGPWLAEPRTINVFKGNKIIVRKIPAKNRLVLAVLKEFFIVDQSIYVGQFKGKKGIDEYYAVGVLSSILTHWFFKTFNNETDDLFPQIKTKQFKELPLKVDNQFIFTISKVTQFLHISKHDVFMDILDALVFELYFCGHMKERGIDVMKLIEQDIEKVMKGREFEKLNENEKEKAIENLRHTWSIPENEVHNRIKMFSVRSPEILKPILDI